jgi:hypothetical protein
MVQSPSRHDKLRLCENFGFENWKQKWTKKTQRDHPSTVTMSNSRVCHFKLVLLGDTAVGKSCLVVRFVRDEFFEFQEPTIGGKNKSTTHEVIVLFTCGRLILISTYVLRCCRVFMTMNRSLIRLDSVGFHCAFLFLCWQRTKPCLHHAIL